MSCGHCGADNKVEAKFCAECGAVLVRTCPACAAVVRPEQKFCDECGTALAGIAAARQGVQQAAHPADPVVAERRVCSVLFADLVGFTTLAEARDPEEVRELLSRYFETARTTIARYGGVVEKFIGDAVMAVWGTPTAEEGDAERAVRAALELVDAVAELGREIGMAGLCLRAGVVTGQMAVTLGAEGQGMVAGDAVNTAARVQAAAEPGSVLVDQGTRRVADGVGFTDAGSHALKGKTDAVHLWRADRVVSGVGGSQRVDGLEGPFVGRDPELRLVKELFHGCVERRTPRLVSVTGLAGVGKSRLGWEFFKYVDGLADTVLWHRGRCLSYGDGVAFWALAEMVRQRLGIAEEDTSAVAGEKLVLGLARWLPDPDERAYVEPRLGQLLGAETGGGLALGRDELFAGWRLFFERLAGHGPVVLLVEDLQHADVGMLDFCEHLLDWARDVPLFLLTLARPELEARRGGWGAGRRNSTALSLEPLADASMAVLLEGLVPDMPAAAQGAIGARAEGIPLYAVETVRMLIDRDVVQPIDGVYRLIGDLGDLAVPATLQSLLAARLDALPPELARLVSDAAVLGGSFPREALAAISGQAPDEVDRGLAELLRREVLGVRADPLSPQRGQYAFVQTMLRQVAYDRLSRRQRKSRHLAVAAHLRESFAGGGEEVAEVVAQHLLDALEAVPDDPDVAELRAEAVAMLVRAGDRGVRTGATASAERSFSAAAQLLEDSGRHEDGPAAAAQWERAGLAAGDVDPQRAIEHLRRSATLYRLHDLPRDGARADVRTARLLSWLGRYEEARVQLHPALSVLEDPPDKDTVAAMGQLALTETFAGNAEGDHLAAAALSAAQALEADEETIDDLLTTRGIGHSFRNRPLEAGAYHREVLRRAERRQDSTAISRALLNLADVLVTTNAVGAAEAARGAAAHCRRVGAAPRLAVAVGNLVLALLVTGEWDEAAELIRVSVDEDQMGSDTQIAFVSVLLHALRGDAARVRAVAPLFDVAVFGEDPQACAGRAMARAAAAWVDGDAATALGFAREALDQVARVTLRNDGVRWAWPLAADAALVLQDPTQVRGLLDWLDGHPRGHVPPVLRAERLRVGVRLLVLLGDPGAGSAFDASTSAFRELGSPYHLAVGLLDQSDHCRVTGDPQVARALAAEALAIAERLRAAPLVERALLLEVPAVVR